MIVKNINGTADSKKCPCGSWINHWENYTSSSNPLCAEITCMKKATDGAHVQKKTSNDDHWYIIPLCHEHNLQTGKDLKIMDSTELIPATARGKCKIP